MRFISPLRYPGGKGKLSKYVQKLVIENDLQDGVYIEPFAGGAAIALDMVVHEYMRTAVINDYDYSIYSIWHSILNHTDEFVKKIKDTPITVKEWKKQKYIHEHQNEFVKFDIGFSAFYLNRANRSGIIKGGIIGGKNQTGNYKIDARFKKENLIKRIEKIAQYKNRIELFNLDTLELIEKVVPRYNCKKTLIYFDPPYYKKGKELYINFYKEKDHKELKNSIDKLANYKWFMTYDNEEFIKELYSEYRQSEYALNYSLANKKDKGKEILIYNHNVSIPFLYDEEKVTQLYTV